MILPLSYYYDYAHVHVLAGGWNFKSYYLESQHKSYLALLRWHVFKLSFALTASAVEKTKQFSVSIILYVHHWHSRQTWRLASHKKSFILSTNKYSVFLQQHPKEACGLLKFERVIDIQNALSVITWAFSGIQDRGFQWLLCVHRSGPIEACACVCTELSVLSCPQKTAEKHNSHNW